jgi:hypothetical protein
MPGGRLFIVVALVLLMAGGAPSAQAACSTASCLTQEQAALYLGCLGAISTTTLSNGQPAASTSLVSGYKSLSQLSTLNVLQFATLEGHALQSYGCCLCAHHQHKKWVSDALKQFSGLGSVSTFTPSTCLSTAAAEVFGSDGTPTCTCATVNSNDVCP